MTASRSWVLQTLQGTLVDLDRVISDSSTVSLHQAESLEWKVELVYRDLLAKDLSGELSMEEQGVLPLIAATYSAFRQVVESIEVVSSSQPPQVLDGCVGRPRFSISYNQLETLINSNFNVPQIAQIIGVSVSTIRRRMNECNLSILSTYSTMSDGYDCFRYSDTVSRMGKQTDVWLFSVTRDTCAISEGAGVTTSHRPGWFYNAPVN